MRRLLALALLHLARTAADTSTAERIRSGQTSSLEEVSRRLARAFRHDDDLRAFVSIFGAEALRAAAARDADTANGFSRGRLHGVPFAIKDLFELDGYATRAGFATAVWEAEQQLDFSLGEPVPQYTMCLDGACVVAGATDGAARATPLDSIDEEEDEPLRELVDRARRLEPRPPRSEPSELLPFELDLDRFEPAIGDFVDRPSSDDLDDFRPDVGCASPSPESLLPDMAIPSSSRFRLSCLRRMVEFQWFLMALSVRPGRSAAILAHFVP